MNFKTIFLNKYFITGFAFLIYMLFFDQHALLNHLRANSKITESLVQKEYYQNKIDSDRKELDQLLNNPEEIERIAREKYFMRKKDEDVFIIKIVK